jgi:valyl-tRNA synthetase
LGKYDAAEVERGLYEWWETTGAFTPKMNVTDTKPFTMMLPPPNVTGSLHIGHALTVAIQDTIVRWSVRFCALNE